MTRQASIVADVGGTHIRFATVSAPDAPLQCIHSYLCADFAQIYAAIDRYLADAGLTPAQLQTLCLALPGAVHTNPVRLVNLPWKVSRQKIRKLYGCEPVFLNDFTAQALAIPAFTAADLLWIRGGDDDPGNPALTRAIVGPGTGLGVAALLPDGEVVESEAGHFSFAPTTLLQQQLLTALWEIYPRVSIERLVSGPGLANLYRALHHLQGRDIQVSPEDITRQAHQGDTMSLQTIEEFNRMFGNVCGDIALAFGAVGGVYLSGGVLHKLGDLFDRQLFLQQFDAKGRYADYCHAIPVALVQSEYPGLLGAARHLQRL
ncbi:MAG: hypothetical protein RLZZ385_1304 [Pseudomonadota bacterium]|jgi:glucokinase